MSASPNVKKVTVFRWGMLVSLLLLASPASAVIVVDTDGLYRGSDTVVGHGVANPVSNAGYLAMRSRGWTAYRYGRLGTGAPLVVVPHVGSLHASSVHQAQVRNHVARAQAYRLGDRW